MKRIRVTAALIAASFLAGPLATKLGLIYGVNPNSNMGLTGAAVFGR